VELILLLYIHSLTGTYFNRVRMHLDFAPGYGFIRPGSRVTAIKLMCSVHKHTVVCSVPLHRRKQKITTIQYTAGPCIYCYYGKGLYIYKTLFEVPPCLTLYHKKIKAYTVMYEPRASSLSFSCIFELSIRLSMLPSPTSTPYWSGLSQVKNSERQQ